jgi:phenylacetate-CoA ligase
MSWNVFFRLHECAKGHATFRILKEMELADRLSAEESRRLQSAKLREFIGYCHRYVPYVAARMAEAGVTPADIRGPADLARLPLMTKADVRANRERLRSTIAGKLASFSTGGSTGEPLMFDLAKRRVAARVACRQRVDHWWGVSVGDPELAIWGSPIEASRQDWMRSLRDRLLATRLLPAFEMNEAAMSRYLDILQKGPCRQIFGYPSAIYLLCLQARKEGRRLSRLGVRVVFVTGEVLFPYQRELIAETLGCPVANGYGGRDSGFVSHECPHGGMHVLDDAVVVEIIREDGRPAPPGESGEIVVTDLYSHEAPFLRYVTGDTGAFAARACGCGRPSSLLERIEGRANDSVVTPDGRIVNSLALVYALREIEGIEQFRVVQQAVDRFHLQLACNGQYPADGEQRIRKGWAALLRAPVHVTFEYLPALAPDPSGKFRHVVSELAARGVKRIEELAADGERKS